VSLTRRPDKAVLKSANVRLHAPELLGTGVVNGFISHLRISALGVSIMAYSQEESTSRSAIIPVSSRGLFSIWKQVLQRKSVWPLRE